MEEIIIKKEVETHHEREITEYALQSDESLHNPSTSKEDDVVYETSQQNTDIHSELSLPNFSLSEFDLSRLKVPQYSLHICNICGEACGSLSMLETHILSHNGEKPVFKCDQCDKVYPDVLKLKRHRYTHRYEISETCDICNKHFTSLPNLKRHKQLHSGDRPFSCILCKETFTRRDKLNMHMLNIHGLQLADCVRYLTVNNINPSVPQDQSDNMLSSENEMQTSDKNLGEVDGENNDTQNFIKSEMIERMANYLNSSMMCEPGTSKEGDSFLFDEGQLDVSTKSFGLNYCDICEKGFTNVYIFKRHMLCHSSDRPHVCIHCSKRYPDTNKLREHMRVHNPNISLTCDVCSKQFGDRANLRRHRLIHNGDRPHQCDFCGKRFTRKDHLKSHRLLHVWNGDIGNGNSNISNQSIGVEGPLNISVSNNVIVPQSMAEIQAKAIELGIFRAKRKKYNVKPKPDRRKSLECVQCHRVFTKSSNLKRHMIVHNNNRIFKKKGRRATMKGNFTGRKESKARDCESSGYKEKSNSNEMQAADVEQSEGDEEHNNANASNIWNPFVDSESTLNKDDLKTESPEFNENDGYDEEDIDQQEDEESDVEENDEEGEYHNDSCDDENTSAPEDNDSAEESKPNPHDILSLSYNKTDKSTEAAISDHDQTLGDNKEEGNNYIEISVPGISDEASDSHANRDNITLIFKKRKRNKNKGDEDEEYLVSRKKSKRKKGSFPCERCGGIFENRLILRRHDCPNKEIYSCGDCGKKFLYLSTYKVHQVVHSKEKPFECPVCMKKFSLIHHLKGHLLTHGGEKPHKCTECFKRFVTTSDLKKHLYSHSDDKNFPCLECNKMFKRPCDVKRHMMIHTGVRPYVCGYCNKSFTQSPHLNSHLLIHYREFQPRESSEIVFGDNNEEN